jgi:hypothetical protein
MTTAENIPCFFDIRRNCPKECALHNKSAEWFHNLVKERNTFFSKWGKIPLSATELLEEMRKLAKENRWLYISGVELVREGVSETEKCAQRENIINIKHISPPTT